MTSTGELDTARVQAFGVKMLGFMNGWAGAMCVSVGHRTGLFDAMAGLGPSSSQQIADAAGLDERYVREWLHALVVSQVIEHDPGTKTYVLPPEHAAAVTRAAGVGNLAVTMTACAVLGRVEDELVEAFDTGSGVPYSSFPAFAEMMAEGSARRFDNLLVDVQIPVIPGVIDRLESGIDVADMGCGSGRAINLMAKQWPNSRFTGYDFSEEATARGSEEAQRWGLTNASFEVHDVSKLDAVDRFDLITTFDAVHDQADPAGMLDSVSRALRPGGTYLCVDVAAATDVADNMDNAFAPFGYTTSLFHCMSVSLAQGGVGLGTMWGQEKALEMLAEAGFTNVEVRKVEGDLLNNYYIATEK